MIVLAPSLVYGQNAEQQLPPDVRLVIDVSGSMKQNDPNNLRQPAVDLLVQLLPEDSKSGVWTFGRWVNMLVKHQIVDEKWRQSAQAKSSKINSVGLYTNIGEALEKAAYDVEGKTAQGYRTSILLLTDGVVDIDKDPAKNKKEWRRIVDEVLPKLKRAGVTIHTIALSENADTDLLNKLSLSTDGIAAIAQTADELMEIFLKAFDVAAPMEQVPLSDEGFVIDSSVEEFTALIFRKPGSVPTKLIGPDQEAYTARTQSKYVNWYKGSNYDLITVKQPLEGTWVPDADMEPNSRVTVVSNLNLRAWPLPNNVFKGQQEELAFVLQEDGNTITRAEFLSLMDITANIVAGKDEFDLREIWKSKIDTKAPPRDGIFKASLPPFDKEGIYQLTVVVDGKSFVREFNHQFTTRQPFGADIKQVYSDGKLEYVLTARSYGGDVVASKTQVVATIVDPQERKKIRPLSPTDVDTWQTVIRPEIEGSYLAKIKVRGENDEGQKFEVNLEPIQFNYSIEQGFIEKEEEFFEESPTPEPTPEPTAEPTAEPTPAPTEAPEAPAEEEGMTDWIIYAVLAAGNLLLFGIGFFVFKKVMGGNKGDEILEQFSEENVAKELEESEEEAPAEEEPEEPEPAMEEMEEEEPPMEDIDPSEDEPEEEESEEPAMEMMGEEEDDDIDLGEDENVPMSEDDLQEIMGEPDEDEMPMPAETVDDPMDDLDDLDQMAVEQEEAAEAKTDEVEEEEDEEDMVAAMLKAQGLDLAEDELDDAISSLIDELENDDSIDDSED